MSMFQQIAKAATMGAFAVLLTTPVAAAEQGGRYWVPKTTSPHILDRSRPIVPGMGGGL
jgi:hypothetical protein